MHVGKIDPSRIAFSVLQQRKLRRKNVHKTRNTNDITLLPRLRPLSGQQSPTLAILLRPVFAAASFACLSIIVFIIVFIIRISRTSLGSRQPATHTRLPAIIVTLIVTATLPLFTGVIIRLTQTLHSIPTHELAPHDGRGRKVSIKRKQTTSTALWRLIHKLQAQPDPMGTDIPIHPHALGQTKDTPWVDTPR
jgi:hypothetical protein